MRRKVVIHGSKAVLQSLLGPVHDAKAKTKDATGWVVLRNGRQVYAGTLDGAVGCVADATGMTGQTVREEALRGGLIDDAQIKWKIVYRNNAGDAQFTPAMVEELRAQYSKLNTVDPSSPSYQKLIQMLNSMPQELLKQLAEANIKFVSPLARNRVRKPTGDVTRLGPDGPIDGSKSNWRSRTKKLGYKVRVGNEVVEGAIEWEVYDPDSGYVFETGTAKTYGEANKAAEASIVVAKRSKIYDSKIAKDAQRFTSRSDLEAAVKKLAGSRPYHTRGVQAPGAEQETLFVIGSTSVAQWNGKKNEGYLTHTGPVGDALTVTAGRMMRFNGNSPDGKVSGSMEVEIVDPHINAAAVAKTEGGRQYEASGARHLAIAQVRSKRGTTFQAYHHQLS